MSEEKKRGFAAMTPEQRKAAREKGIETRRRNKAAKAAASVLTPAPMAGISERELQDAVKDPNNLNNVLDRFRYTRNPNDIAIWTLGRDVSPVTPPQEVTKKYPELEWKLLSKKKIDRLGHGYEGWEVFKDGEYPTGIERSNDSIFGVRPKELGDQVRRARQQRALAAVTGLEEARMEEMRQRAAEAHDPNTGPIENEKMKDGRVAGTGILFGKHNIQNRSERLRERFIKQSEANRSKVYFDLGKR